MIRQEHCTVISKKHLTNDIVELSLTGELVNDMDTPGQFVHLKVTESRDLLLRRPISIAKINRKEQSFTVIFRINGMGTRNLVNKDVGDAIDVLGPLGNGFPVTSTPIGGTALLVGGGIGVPPLYELSARLVERGVNVVHVFGFSSKEAVFYEKEFAELGETYLATVDGTYGQKGFVTDVIEANQLSNFDTLYACGPTSMLRALELSYPQKEMFLSLEERMACGIGACFACVCRTSKDPASYDYKKVCSDGPVFRVGEVVL